MAKPPKKSSTQKSAEADVDAFRKRLGPFVTAAETTRMAMVFTDAKAPGDPITFANDSFLALTGYDRAEVLGKSFNFLMKHVAGPKALAKIEAELEGGRESVSEEHCRRKDGAEFWAATFISPVRDETGDIVQHFGSFVDLTRHMQEQTHSKMLIDELNHRVKNTLSTVQSIVWQALRATPDQEDIRTRIESRLHALSRSHDLLTRENWKGAGLFDLITVALEPFGVTGESAKRVVIEGQNIRVPPNAALALGIAFHELATNAAKYGSLSNKAGSVRITWKIEPKPQGDRLILEWREKNGPRVVASSHKGFGSRVLERGLMHEFGGVAHLDYPASGLVFSMDVPAPRKADSEPSE